MAKWTIKDINQKDERNLLIGLIVNDEFIKKLYPILKPELLTKYGRTIAKWCLDYYSEYEKAPGIEIQDIYQRREKELDEDTGEIVAKTLSSLSNALLYKEIYDSYLFPCESVSLIKTFF